MFTGERRDMLVADAVPTFFNIPLNRPSDTSEDPDSDTKIRGHGIPSFDAFINKSEFKCLECEELFCDYCVFVGHLNSAHFMDAVSYLVKHQLKEMATAELHFQCPLCSPSDITTWTSKSLERHAKQEHLITLRQLYERAYGKDVEGEEFKGDVCEIEVKTEPNELDDRAPNCSSGSKSENTPSQGYWASFNSWMNKCEFKCLECNVMFYEELSLSAHIKLTHFLDVDSYTRKHEVRSLVTTELLFKCSLCSPSDLVTWTRESLEQHARQEHQSSLYEFYLKVRGKAEGEVSARSEVALPSPSKTNNRRVELSIDAKREIIRSYDALPRMSQQCAAKVLQIPRMTLRRMLSKRDEIMDAPNSSMKRYRVGKDAMVEDALVRWFETMPDKTSISQEMLVVKSEELAREFGHDEFKASRGWLYRLCKRSGMKDKMRGLNRDEEMESLAFMEPEVELKVEEPGDLCEFDVKLEPADFNEERHSESQHQHGSVLGP